MLYHHTQYNRRVRKVDLNEIDFDASGKLMQLPLDKEKAQNIEDVTPRKKFENSGAKSGKDARLRTLSPNHS